MRELEGGKLNRVFIGRHAEREDVKTRLADGERVLLLHGQAMVGKASLARQVAEELQAENEAQGNDPLIVYTVDCKAATDWPDVMKAVCSALSLDGSLANENLLLGAVLQHAREAGSGGVMLLLLRLHSLEPHSRHVDELARFLNSLADSDVTTIVTSRRRLNLPSVYQVKPLTDADALRLLSHQARDANPDDFADILKRCHGVPILILQVAKYVSGDPMFAYTADELKQALEEDPALLMRDLGKEAEDLFSRLSREVQGHVSKLAQLLDGTFSMDVLQAALGVEGARAKTVLRRLCDESPLIVDTRSKRMFIEPLVLHHVRQLGHVDADDQARLRVVTLMGRVLTHAEHELYVEGQNTVYGHLHGDWPQLQHLLRQAIHCTDNTYQAYLKVAVESDKLLVKCFPEEAMQFYQNMASAAVRFGTRRDQAVLQGLIGMAVTQGRGTGWQEALQYFHRALPILRDDDRSINLPRLLCDMGFTYFKLNRLGESHRYLREALEVSEKTEVEDDRQVFLLIRARSLLALPAIFRGQLTAGKRLLEETLELCSQLAPHHPDKPILINSIGLVYERSGESQEMAMDYYLRSLAERRRYAEVAPGDLVPCLNNIGMQYGRRGNYELAFKHLEEAAAIRARSGRWHYYTALTQQHLGQLCLQRGDYKRAESHLLEASEVYARCTPGHDVRGKVALCLAHVYITPPCRDVKNVRKYLTQVCELADASGEDLSDAGLLVAMSAVQHRMQLDGWQARHVRPLWNWVQKHLDQFGGDPSQQLSEHLSIIKAAATLCDLDTTDDQREAVVSRVLEHCQMCVALEVNSDVREFWREVEKQTESFRKGRSLLLGSKSLKEVIELSEEAEDRQMSRLVSRACSKTSTSPVESRFHTQVLPSPVDKNFSGLGNGHLAVGHNEQDQRLLSGVSGETDMLRPYGLCQPGQTHQLPYDGDVWAFGNRQAMQESCVQGNTPDRPTQTAGRSGSTQEVVIQGRVVTDVLNSQSDQGRSATGQYNRRVGWSSVGDDPPRAAVVEQSEKLQLFDVYTEAQHYRAGRPDASPESRRHHSPSYCSFTSSEPPSTVHTDVTEPPTPHSMPREHLSDVTFHMGRFIFPLQETARDQIYLQATSMRSDYDADTSAVVVSQQLPATETQSLADSEDGLRGFAECVGMGGNVQRGVQSSNEGLPPTPLPPASSSPGPDYQTDVGQSQSALTTADAKSEKPVFDIQSLRTIYTLQRTTSTLSESRSKHAANESAAVTGLTELVPHAAQSTQSPRPEPTLDDVVSCAQQLLTALPSDDPQAAGHVVTADQRRALAKLASLHDVHTQWAGKSLEEQRAALVKIASQRDSDGSSTTPHSASSVETSPRSPTISGAVSTGSTSSPKEPLSVSSGYERSIGSRVPCETEDTDKDTKFMMSELKLLTTDSSSSGVKPVSREATENDERLENPEHVCTSVNCCCSLQSPRH